MKQVFTDIMLDLETLGNAPGCVVFAIGAVPFNASTGKVGTPEESFYRIISVSSARAIGLTSNTETLNWWKDQKANARKEFIAAHEGGDPIELVLRDFSSFCRAQGRVRIWGKGPSFDCSVLRAAYEMAHIRLPWKFWDERCVRTVYDAAIMGRPIPEIQPEIPHHALYDARAQALNVCAVVSPSPEKELFA